MTRRPWRLPASEVRAFRLLEHIANGDTTWVEELDGLGVDREDLAAVLRDLEYAGRVELEPRCTMRLSQVYPGARLTSTGAAYVENLCERRADPVARARASRVEVLLWLYDTDQHMPVTTKFLELGKTYYDTLFTEKDINGAAKYLYDLGLISGVGASGWGAGGAPLRSEITTAGRACVEDNDAETTREREQPATSAVYNQHNYNSTGSIAQGEHAQAITHQGLQPDDVKQLQEIFTSGLSALEDPFDRQDAEQAIHDLIDDLQAEQVDAEQVKRRIGALERLAARIGNAALMAAASEGGKRTLELLASAI